jgi:hypothetical protein
MAARLAGFHQRYTVRQASARAPQVRIIRRTG